MPAPTATAQDATAPPPACRCTGERHDYGAAACRAAAAVPRRDPVAADPYETPGRFVVSWDEPVRHRRVVVARNQAAASSAVERELQRTGRDVPTGFHVVPEALA